MIKLAIIGYGYWGPNLVRNFFNLNSCAVSVVADTRVERLNLLKKNYPSIKTTIDVDDIFNDKSVDAVVIAVPVSSHFKLANKALEKGKHVLVEKPMTFSLKNAEELISMAKKKKRVLMVDHTFLYTDAVQKIKLLIDKGEIGKVKYFDSTRINLGLFQKDANVLWDLAAHDISILLYLVSEKPQTVSATGVSHTKNKIENIAFMTLKYKSGLIAHFDCSWSSPVKVRQTLIGGSKKMIVYNDVEPTEKIKIYDSGYQLKKNKLEVLVDYRTGDIQIPKIDLKEGLSSMASDFLSAIKTGKKPISDSQLGLEVVKILSLADQSMKLNGKPIRYEKN